MRRRHTPQRTCVGCRARGAKGAMLRVVRRSDGDVVADPSGRELGRGAYLHRSESCVEAALGRGGLARALRAGVHDEAAGRLRRFIDIDGE